MFQTNYSIGLLEGRFGSNDVVFISEAEETSTLNIHILAEGEIRP